MTYSVSFKFQGRWAAVSPVSGCPHGVWRCGGVACVPGQHHGKGAPQTPKNVGDSGVMRHGGMAKIVQTLLNCCHIQKHCKHHMLCHMVYLQKGPKDIDHICIYIYIYMYIIPPKKSLPKSGSLGVRQNNLFGQPKCLQGCAMTDS